LENVGNLFLIALSKLRFTKVLPRMSDECPRYIFRQDTHLCGG